MSTHQLTTGALGALQDGHGLGRGAGPRSGGPGGGSPDLELELGLPVPGPCRFGLCREPAEQWVEPADGGDPLQVCGRHVEPATRWPGQLEAWPLTYSSPCR